uniref:NADH-ubiquinone oxidoreductase chain 6 n=1 Tax=Desmomyia sinensis TaxID=2816992 RepID=A0A8A4VQ27_9DIPT|nr:NADH dehydrogenase subunit 6 [Desmomyia sinensis]QTD82963.1 NADH dehydrogenase subunit 6 [Desmomyia sinensis]
MMYMFIYSITITMSFIFTQMTHPLAMGLVLLLQTLLICLITGLFTKTFWFSYILFLIFLGGMLVLFIYVTSLASNEMFSFSMKTFTISLMFLMFIMMFFFIMDSSLINNMFINNEMYNLNIMNSYIKENSLNLNKLYNFPSNMITLLLINYLLLTLIAVVKITNIFYGPLRPMN